MVEPAPELVVVSGAERWAPNCLGGCRGRRGAVRTVLAGVQPVPTGAHSIGGTTSVTYTSKPRGGVIMPRRFTLALSVACAAAWVLALLPRVDPAYAASFTVATAADAPHSSPVDGTCASQLPGNPCTLRAAIEAANSLGGGPHRIELLPGTYQLTAGALPIDASLLLVSANGNSGEPSVVVDGNGADRVLDVGRRAVAEVVLVGVVVQNGNPGPAADGGAVQVHAGSTLRMTNGAVLNSRAANGAGIGSDGTVRLINTEVSNNVATGAGGGILSRGSLTLVNGGARNN